MKKLMALALTLILTLSMGALAETEVVVFAAASLTEAILKN